MLALASMIILLISGQAMQVASKDGVYDGSSMSEMECPSFRLGPRSEIHANITLSRRMTFHVVNATFAFSGSIDLRDSSEFLIERSNLTLDGLELYDEARLIIVDSVTSFRSITAHQTSEVVLNRSIIESLFYAFDESVITAQDSVVKSEGYEASQVVAINSTFYLGPLDWYSKSFAAVNSRVVLKKLNVSPEVTASATIEHFINCNGSSKFFLENPDGSLEMQEDSSRWVKHNAYSLDLLLIGPYRAPVSGARVVFYRNGTAEIAATFETDSSGRVTLALDEGEYDVEAHWYGGVAHVATIDVDRCTRGTLYLQSSITSTLSRMWTEAGVVLLLSLGLLLEVVRRRSRPRGSICETVSS